MSVETEIPRASLLWLLLAQAFVVVLHVAHLPGWIVLLWLICSFWRVQIFRLRLAYPGRWLKWLLVLGAGAAVFFSRGQLLGLDAGVVLLLAAFLLKLLEMRSRRDAWVLIFLGFFVLSTAYLFETGVWLTLFSLIPLLLLLAAMISLQGQPTPLSNTGTLKLAGVLVLQALPLMLLLFVFFPRMGPLWSLPMPTERGVTGLSESMSPNDIAELSRSDALAFRATFAGAVPAREQLYWRALTLERFDGRRWSQLPQEPLPAVKTSAPESFSYQVLMQPTGQRWLFALDVASSQTPEVERMLDGRLQASMPVEGVFRYAAQAREEAPLQQELAAWQRQRLVQLPSAGEPRTRAWAEQLRQQYPDDQALVAALLQHFNRQPFAYTLKPPMLAENAVDGFLFETQRGFCAHYAGAMVYVLRAANIPARVVAGYQGGELGPGANTVQVRQFDAHAWVEYWHPELGWQRVDPTAAVAPERIELGLEAALLQEQSFLENSPFSPLRYRHIGWLNQLRLGLDQLDHGWQQWVLNYQAQEQVGLLKRWFGRGFDAQVLASLAAVAVLLMLLLALLVLKPWRARLAPAQRLQQRFERILRRQGVERAPGEGPQAFGLRAAEELPEQAALIQQFTQRYMAHYYAGQEVELKSLRAPLRQLRQAFRWRRLG